MGMMHLNAYACIQLHVWYELDGGGARRVSAGMQSQELCSLPVLSSSAAICTAVPTAVGLTAAESSTSTSLPRINVLASATRAALHRNGTYMFAAGASKVPHSAWQRTNC